MGGDNPRGSIPSVASRCIPRRHGCSPESASEHAKPSLGRCTGLVSSGGRLIFPAGTTSPNRTVPPNCRPGRPVFSTDERRIYLLLREALPHHIILRSCRWCASASPRPDRRASGTTCGTNLLRSPCAVPWPLLPPSTRRRAWHSPASINKRRAVVLPRSLPALPTDHLPSVADLHFWAAHWAASLRGPSPHTLPRR